MTRGKWTLLAAAALLVAAAQQKFEYKSYKLMLTVSGANCGGG